MIKPSRARPNTYESSRVVTGFQYTAMAQALNSTPHWPSTKLGVKLYFLFGVGQTLISTFWRRAGSDQPAVAHTSRPVHRWPCVAVATTKAVRKMGQSPAHLGPG